MILEECTTTRIVQTVTKIAYIPGLRRRELHRLVKTRRLPVKGEVLVEVGDEVSLTTVVARTYVPGEFVLVPVPQILGVSTKNAQMYMLKKLGDFVKEDEALASKKYRRFFGLDDNLRYFDKTNLFGFDERVCRSPISGVIYHIYYDGGVVVSRPIQVEVKANIPGNVIKVLTNEGVVIETQAAYVQGVFGIGSEAHGELMVLAESPEETLTSEQICADCSGKILVGGAIAQGEVLNRAVEVNAEGIVVGGIEDEALFEFLGYDIGVGITGQEEVGLTLIITEGFGKMRMSERTFALLKRFDGKLTSVNGTTQIRAGVIRPEIIIPRSDVNLDDKDKSENKSLEEGLKLGDVIKIIREPYFGALGRVVSLPVEPQRLDTESKVRVLEAELDDGIHVIVPRANVEIIIE